MFIALAGAAPAGAATSVIAAYEKYVPGQGFEIGLVDTGTGAALPVPAGVNTAADELHPALSADGRWLVFSRMTLTPQLNGNVVPPAARSILRVDRTTTVEPVVLASGGAGPTYTALNRVSWGRRQVADPTGSGGNQENDDLFGFATLAGDAPSAVAVNTNPPFGVIPTQFTGQPGVRDVAAAVSMAAGVGGNIVAYQSVLFDEATGEVRQSVVTADGREPAQGVSVFFNGLDASFAGAANTGHPALRTTDRYLAFDESSAADGTDGGSIKSVLLGRGAAEPAPDPVNTADDERQPAWSPDDRKLAFVRTGATGPRRLFAFDLTPGIQTVVNPGLDIGAVAPNPQLRRFQAIWGGIGLAIVTRPDAANPVCDLLCRSRLLTTANPSVRLLSPTVRTSTPAKRTTPLTIGISVARITGTTKVLGRTVPRLRPVGRVPLGAARRGRNAFRWNGRVAGRRLAAGSYVLTFRTLTRSGRVHSLSESVRLRLDAAGRITSVRPLAPRRASGTRTRAGAGS